MTDSAPQRWRGCGEGRNPSRKTRDASASVAPARAHAGATGCSVALNEKPASITLDYLELYGLRPAVERVQAAGITARVASPRVLKPNEAARS